MMLKRITTAVWVAALVLGGAAACGGDDDDDDSGTTPDGGGTTPDAAGTTPDAAGTTPDAGATDLCPDLAYDEEGFIDVPGGRVWYGIYGTGDKTPILTVHGGPGVPHYYFLPFMKELADAEGRPVIFYDQLGSGRSDRVTDTSLYNVDRYIEELGDVVAGLGLKEFHLWGHSWGTQLGLLYAATQPAGLRSLILASPIIDIPTYRQDLFGLLAEEPQEVQDGINNNEPGSKAYVAALNEFYADHLVTIDPFPDCWNKAFSAEQFGVDSYSAMIGTDELNYTGVLMTRDDSGALDDVQAPIWFNCGGADLAIPERCEQYSSQVPGSVSNIFPGSSHAYFDEERPAYLTAFQDFLAGVEK